MAPLLGCIADDFTGGTDLASILAESGLATVQLFGIPQSSPKALLEADAVVISLKCRSIPAHEAQEQALQALQALKNLGCRQFFWKYCSTFDSTDQGNIGPVAEVLRQALGNHITVVCPSFPANGRTVYQGHLFVGDLLLNESSMRHHPLTPMTDANIVRVLGRQTSATVGLVPLSVVRQGAEAVKRTLTELEEKGVGMAVTDATEDNDLYAIAKASAQAPLITGGSAVAMGLAGNYKTEGLWQEKPHAGINLPSVGGLTVALSGSCSSMTLAQVAAARKHWPSQSIDPYRCNQEGYAEELADFVCQRWEQGPVLLYAGSDPQSVRAVQQNMGIEAAGSAIESIMGQVAHLLRQRGCRRFIVAGGETSGAVGKALGVTGVRIGPCVAVGVPWTVSLPVGQDQEALGLIFKSGNFGDETFFSKAAEMAP